MGGEMGERGAVEEEREREGGRGGGGGGTKEHNCEIMNEQQAQQRVKL